LAATLPASINFGNPASFCWPLIRGLIAARDNNRYEESCVYTLPELIVIGVAALLIGAGAGIFLSRLFNTENRKSRELEKQLQDASAELKNYQQEVSEHYVKTARLVDNLTESYRDVHNHLAEGAATLLNTRSATPLMKTIPSREQIEAISEPVTEDKVLPPLDYAPKKSPGEKGMLDESFGLDKDNAREPETNPLQELYGVEGTSARAESRA
jgi:hypothetical protein